MVNRPDFNIVQTFENLWAKASIHAIEKGDAKGISEKEFNSMSVFLNNAINDKNSSEGTKQWARQKLSDLNTMKHSFFNFENNYSYKSSANHSN